MGRRALRAGLFAGGAGALAALAWNIALRLRPFDPAPMGDPVGSGLPPRPPSAPWVEPVGGACPGSHPVKAKLASGIFHAPGNAAYERTRPDRCYLDPAAAKADGLRPAKR